MLRTKVEETINLDNGKTVTAKICLSITKVNFSLVDKSVIAYVKMGYETVQLVPLTDGETEIVEVVISQNGKGFTQDRLKEMLEDNTIVFNSDGSNLLVDNMNANAVPILQSIIAIEPQDYFGLTLDKWGVK